MSPLQRTVRAAGVAAAAGVGLAAFTLMEIRRVQRLVPADGGFLELPGARIHYRDEGRGPALVFVHGLGGQMRHFSHSLLGRLNPRYRVVLVDRPGSGYSTALSGTHPGLRQQARIVAGVIRKLGVERPLLVGHSLGGALALALALDEPDLISGLALIAPLTRVVTRVPPPFRALAIRSAVARRLVSWTLVAPAGRIIARRQREVFFPDPVADNFHQLGGGALTFRPSAFYAASCEVLAAEAEMAGLVARYATLRVPIEILFGRGDPILSPAVHGEQFLRLVPGARLALVEGGHMLPVTSPDLTARWIEAVHARISTCPSDRPSAV